MRLNPTYNSKTDPTKPGDTDGGVLALPCP